jgi:hypothetical protein
VASCAFLNSQLAPLRIVQTRSDKVNINSGRQTEGNIISKATYCVPVGHSHPKCADSLHSPLFVQNKCPLGWWNPELGALAQVDVATASQYCPA